MIREDGTVACGSCGEVDDAATGVVQGLRADIANVEQELRSKRRRIKELQGEQNDALKSSPHYGVAMRVLERWRERCAPNARELTGNHRLENVIARLRGKYTEEELLLAVEGYARSPFVVNKGRSPVGSPDQWFADAELIFRTPGHVNRGVAMARAEQGDPVPLEVLGMIPWRRVRLANRQRMVAFLEGRFGGLLEEGEFLLSPCPRCSSGGDLGLVLSVSAPASTLSWVVECRVCGLGDERLLALIEFEERMDAAAGSGESQLRLAG